MSDFPTSSSNFLLFLFVISLLLSLRRVCSGEFYGVFEPPWSRPLQGVGAHWSCLSLCLLWEDFLTSVFVGGTWEPLSMPLHTKDMDKSQCRLGWCFPTSVSSPSCNCASSPSVLALKSFICTHLWGNTNHRKSRSPRLDSWPCCVTWDLALPLRWWMPRSDCVLWSRTPDKAWKCSCSCGVEGVEERWCRHWEVPQIWLLLLPVCLSSRKMLLSSLCSPGSVSFSAWVGVKKLLQKVSKAA